MGQFEKTFRMKELSADIVLCGAIDEKFVFETIPSTIRTVNVDVENIEYISSFGVKLWVKWISTLPREATLVLHKARPSTLANVNAVEGFVLPKTVVQSVLVPFTTDDGEEGTDIALEFGKHYTANGTFNFPAPKASTGETMVPDFIPERLFKFLRA